MKDQANSPKSVHLDTLQDIIVMATNGLRHDVDTVDLLLKIQSTCTGVLGSIDTPLMGSQVSGTEWSMSLAASQYVLPSELLDVTPRIITQITSTEGNSGFQYSGLLLYGVPGTGKSEYISYLKGVVGDKVIFYSANIAEIRNAKDPAIKLDRLYEHMQSLAQQTGKYVVLLIDEMDIFMQEFSTIKNRRTSHVHAGQNSKNTQTVEESESVIDPVGSQLFSTLKTLMQGTGKCARVFTISTTNLASIPDALSRDGRFNAIKLGYPFHNFSSFNHDSSRRGFDYLPYFDYMSLTLKIFSATYCRKHNLNTTPKEFLQLMAEVTKLKEKYVKTKEKNIQNPKLKDGFNQKQIVDLRTRICDFLEIPEDASIRYWFTRRLEPITYGHSFTDYDSGFSRLTQSKLAGEFKSGSYSLARKEILWHLRNVLMIKE